MLSEIESRLVALIEERDREMQALRDEIQRLGTLLDLTLKNLDELSSRLQALSKELT